MAVVEGLPFIFALLLLLLVLILIIRRKYFLRLQKQRNFRDIEKQNGKIVVGLFHPYCNSGGGGERVLWCAIQALQEISPCIHVVIYARRSVGGSEAEMLNKAKDRFGVGNLNTKQLSFVYLRTEKLLQAETFPRLTLLGQSLGSIVVGLEALYRCMPDIYIDTMGYAFTYPIVYLFSRGSRIATYTHYPTISTDMLQRVYERRPAYNNDELVSNSQVTSRIKYMYYVAFSLLYRLVGGFAELVMVNSSWTKMHIDSLWKVKSHIVYPPCDVAEFSDFITKPSDRKNIIVSLGQFRPEKDHRLQLSTLAALREKIKEQNEQMEDAKDNIQVPKLLMFGSCRDGDDERRVDELKKFAEKLKVSDLVEFHLNKSFTELKQTLSVALLGIHTMWNEHFGIAPVEMQASGIILCAHNSGGPKMDIVTHGKTGYLATDAQEYAQVFLHILSNSDEDKLESIRNAARASVSRFSQENFNQRFKATIMPLFT